MKLLRNFALASIVMMSACVSVKKNAVFGIAGVVSDGYGNPTVISADDNVQICVKANYISNAGHASSFKECTDVITDQEGHYKAGLVLQIKDLSNVTTIEIKSAKVFGQKYDSNSGRFYYFPVSITHSSVSVDGGIFNGNMSVFNAN